MLAESDGHPLDALVRDPSGDPPLCDEPEFAQLVEGMVADEAPRLFAVVQEYGDRVDARIAAWGMSFDDHADVIGIEGELHLGVPSPDRVVRVFGIGTRVASRLVWVNSEADSTPMEDDAEALSRHDDEGLEEPR